MPHEEGYARPAPERKGKTMFGDHAQNMKGSSSNRRQEIMGDLHEDEWPSRGGTPRAIVYEMSLLAVAKWKITAAFLYLTTIGALCLTAIVINPSIEVRFVAVAVWLSSGAIGGALVRRAGRRF